jgi:hypothetical protein
MARHHKKTKKHSRRRRMRGGMFPFTRWDGSPWSAPEAVAAEAAPVVDNTIGTPAQQADALGVAPGAPSAPAGMAPGATSLGGRRRKTRKHRKTRRH